MSKPIAELITGIDQNHWFGGIGLGLILLSFLAHAGDIPLPFKYWFRKKEVDHDFDKPKF